MAEHSGVITLYRRVKLAQITSGEITKLAPIKHIAFGDGGTDGSGNVLIPSETQTELRREFCRYEIDNVAYPVNTTARYTVTIPKGEQTGRSFSEMGLIDGDGMLCGIKNMLTKQKDEDLIFTFEFDDEF